ncbi:MAG TPA: Ig-like domain-containing protein [Solirubrobacterales bacterium]|nr:Ig-like domain-containing protein [Solirubrobacterales bacterium]
MSGLAVDKPCMPTAKSLTSSPLRTALLALLLGVFPALVVSAAASAETPARADAVCAKRAAAAPAAKRQAVQRKCLKAMAQGTASKRRSSDTTAPSVKWQAPTAGATVKGNIEGASCVASASDNRGVVKVVMKVDGAVLNTEIATPWNCHFDTTKVANGSHTLSATAFDAAGNSRTASISVNVANVSSPAPTEPTPAPAPTEPAPGPTPAPEPEPAPAPSPEPAPAGDTTAPSVSWQAPTAGATVSGNIEGTKCVANASDAGGVDRVVMKVDGSTLNTEIADPWNCHFDTTKVTNGSHTLSATAFDDAGNSRTASVTVNVANVPTPSSAPAPNPEPAPAPAPAPSPGVSGMMVGLDAGNYGSTGASDVRGAVNTVRYETERGLSGLEAFKKAGLRVQLNFSGPYSTGGVCALNQSSWVADTLAYYKANTTPTISPTIEVLNEPGGTWFWGSNAMSSSNAVCYRDLVKKTYAAFHGAYGSSAPKILATIDGPGGLAWGKAWLTSDWATYVDGFIVHPYGGTGSKTSSALGNRALIEGARSLTGGPIYITEVGWPTAITQSATGDSLQWSEADQATNLTNFIAWCKGTGYVAEVIYFNYRDFGSSSWYGVLRTDGSKKPAYEALRQAAVKYGA